MEQHPVPQQISSYQFRLVGDMTLKQFFQLAGGGLIALLIYASPFPAFIKWPLIILFVILGAALAFLPIEERPLEVWIVAFFRSIYAPTFFHWKKLATPTPYFATETAVTQAVSASTTSAPAASPPQAAPVARLEEAEKTFLSKLTGIFSLPHSAPAPVAAAPAPQPTPAAPPPQLVVPPPPKVVVQKQPVYVAPTPAAPIQPAAAKTTEVRQTFQTTAQPQGMQAAQFSPEASPPTPPSMPNLIVGQVMDPVGKIIEGAILEIKDTGGRPVRALRTNKAGHFLIVTPLVNGTYEITLEKPGFVFDPVTFTATGAIIEPLLLRAKAVATQ
jgi:hypothetical protein